MREKDWTFEPENCEHNRLIDWFESRSHDEMAFHIKIVQCQMCGEEFSPRTHDYGGDPYLLPADSSQDRSDSK